MWRLNKKIWIVDEKSWTDQFYIRKQSSQSNRRIEMKFCMKSINMFSYIDERYHPNGSLVKTNDLSRNKPDGLHGKKNK
jgi:hypothetical protein